MKTATYTLLVPVCASLDTAKAVAEAISRATPRQTTIHLVHLVRSSNPMIMIRASSASERTPDDDLESYVRALFNLFHWKDLIEKSCHGVAVRIHLKKGFSWQYLLQQTTRKVGSGMIILAARQERRWLSAWNSITWRLLALSVGCRLLSVKPYASSVPAEKTQPAASAGHIPIPVNKNLRIFCLQSFSDPISQN